MIGRAAADLLMLTGLTLTLVGLEKIWPPLPWVFGGVALMVAATRLEQKYGTARPDIRNEPDRP